MSGARRILAAWLMVALVTGAAVAEVEMWVAPDGDDRNPGTRDEPLASPALALRKVRELRRLKDERLAGGASIVLRDGIYYLPETVRVRSEDSGTEASPTTMKAEAGARPRLSGGVRLGGWERAPDVPGASEAAAGKLWRAKIPGFQGRPLEFRQLWVAGRKAIRARTPNGDDMTPLLAWDRARREACISATAAGMPARVEGVELVMLQMWEIAVLRVKAIRKEGDRLAVTFHDPESQIQAEHPWPQPTLSENPKFRSSVFFLANSLSFLDEPGEWFADTARGEVYYWPREGEDLEQAIVVAPALETVLAVTGTVERPVRQVVFQGISFGDTGWMRPSLKGHVPLQAGFPLVEAYGLKPKGTPEWRSLDNQAWLERPPAAVTVEGAEQLRFVRCEFSRTGASGLDLVEAVHDSVVEGCRFRDIGINGLVAGEFARGGMESHLPFAPREPGLVCGRLRLANNLFTDCANEDWGGVALLAGFVQDTEIAHNEIRGTSYTGINLGWGWTRAASALARNRVIANRIEEFATRMSDTAGIYTLSAQPGTVIRENVIGPVRISRWVHDPEHWFYLYADEGTAHTVWRDNWCPEERFLQNANGPDNVWENNGPQVDRAIRARAGLEPAFQDLRANR